MTKFREAVAALPGEPFAGIHRVSVDQTRDAAVVFDRPSPSTPVWASDAPLATPTMRVSVADWHRRCGGQEPGDALVGKLVAERAKRWRPTVIDPDARGYALHVDAPLAAVLPPGPPETFGERLRTALAGHSALRTEVRPDGRYAVWSTLPRPPRPEPQPA
jgi:hypothetical protein